MNRQQVQKWQFLYLMLFVMLFMLIVCIAYAILIRVSIHISRLWYFYFMMVALLMAERFTDLIFVLLINNPIEPNKLSANSIVQSEKKPKVAILYCTCDDMIESSIKNLTKQDYPNVDVFILDDSTQLSNQEKIDKIVSHINDTVTISIIRRPNRAGFKAGNINNWLKHYENGEYDYFIVLDADSSLKPDFIFNMLHYAEHADNQLIAMFESCIQMLLPQNGLQFASVIQLEITRLYSLYLTNRLGIGLSNGHNNLCRTQYFRPDQERTTKQWGFDEAYIGEDHATSLNLYSQNLMTYTCDVLSFEISPSTLTSLRARTSRWVRNDLQLLSHPWKNISTVLQLKLVLQTLSYVLWIPVFYLIVQLWFYQSTFDDLIQWVQFIGTPLSIKHPQVVFLVYIILLYLLSIPSPK